MKVSTYSSITDLPAAATSLLNNAEHHSMFYGATWFNNFEKYLVNGSNDARYYAMAMENTDSPQLIIPMYRDASLKSGKLPARELWSMTNYYSSLYGPILSSDCGEDQNVIAGAFREFASALKNDGTGWDIVNFKPMELESETFSLLEKNLSDAGFVTQRYFCFGNWYLNVEGRSFQEYFQSLSSRVRNTVNRKEKKLLKEEGVDIRIVTDASQANQLMDDYEKIYMASWKQPEPSMDFIRAIVNDYAQRDCLRMGIVYYNGEPAAAQIWFVTHGIASIFKLAYDEKYKKMSMGSILTKRLMEHVIDIDHVAQIDYLTGDDNYKKEWMTNRRERWGIVAINKNTLKGKMLIGLEYLTRLIKKIRT